MNGVPWWFLPSLPGYEHDPPLESVDSGGHLLERLGVKSVLGTVVNTAASTPERGVSETSFLGPLILGEPLSSASPRLNTTRLSAISGLLNAANIETTPDIHSAVWNKLMLNMVFNPLSALTRSTLNELASEPLIEPLIRRAWGEGVKLGEALGLRPSHDLTGLLERYRQGADFKPSMLQDLEKHHSLEVGSLLSAPRELGERLGLSIQAIDGLHALAYTLDKRIEETS